MLKIIFTAIILFFYLNNPVFAAAKITADVPPNPINQLNQQLKEKEAALAEKEKQLQQQEQNSSQKTFYYLLIIGGALLLNFYLDYRHRKKYGGQK